MPVTFPPEDVPNGELLAGLPLPDIRGTMGTFYYFATDLSRYEEGNTEFGGILKRLVIENDVAHDRARSGRRTRSSGRSSQAIRRQGPRLSDGDRDGARRAAGRGGRAAAVDDSLESRGEDRRRSTSTARRSLLEPGKMSRWVDLDFRINFFVRVHGMVQLLLMNADSELQLYISPVNWKPDNPPVPMSSPASFSGDLFKQLGYYRTLGWAEATWPLNEGRMDEKTFMDDLDKAFDDRAQVILNRARRAANWDVLVGVIESTDRVQHMMWRLIDPTASDVRRGARAPGSATRSSRSTGAPTSSSARCSSASSPGTAGPDRLGSRLPLVAQGGQPEHLAGPAGLHGAAGAAAGREEARRSVRRRRSSGKTSTGRGRARTPWASARSTSTSAAAKRKGIVSPGAEATQLADELRARLLDAEGSRRRVAHRPRGLQTRRRVFGRVPAERRRSCRSAWRTATASPGRRRSADRRRASCIRT